MTVEATVSEGMPWRLGHADPRRWCAGAMDRGTKCIAEFASRPTFEDLPAEVVHDCKRPIMDTRAAIQPEQHSSGGVPASDGARTVPAETGSRK